MKKLSVDEIREIELNMLVDIAEFCERNNIDYFISCGTLLGSVRHKGFIPWDDDADITMPRDSYEKFISTYQSDKDYEIVSINNNVRYDRPFARVVSTKTRRSALPSLTLDLRVCIDVFPLDFYDTKQQAEDVYTHLTSGKNSTGKDRTLLLFELLKKTGLRKSIRESQVWKIVQPTVSCILDWIILRKINVLHLLRERASNDRARAMDRYIQDHCGHKGNYALNTLAPTNKMPEIFRYSDIFPTSLSGSFEGHTFRVPNDTDMYLRLLYGDYMTPPPVEHRKPCHYKTAYLTA